MNRKIIFILITLFAIAQTGCKKFLDVKPLDKLAGNAFFKDRQDVESNVWDTYGLLRDKIGSYPFLAWSGDLRSGMMGPSPEASDRDYRMMVPMNKLQDIYTGSQSGEWWWVSTFGTKNFFLWKNFYKVITASNNLYFELTRKPIEGLTGADIKRYQAEAVFIRCLTYFFMVRTWGDVPYFTDPYHETPLPRMDMVKVVNNCLADLMKVKDDLPWTYSDPAFLGVRATKGSVLVLMMNLAMWNAGFDKGNLKKYAQETADWGKEIIDSKSYELLPMKDFNTIFKGRTKESLFEIAQNSNYGEILMYNTFPDMVLHYPYKRPISSHHYSFTYFRSTFLQMLFPTGQPDLRVQYWFDENMMADNGNFQYLKFTNVYAIADGEDVNPDNNLIIFRYAGAILLRAEALADIGQTAEAINMLNIVRARAQATLYTGSGGEALFTAIFAERAKELMGEGHYYYDLVRTGKVMQQQWDYYPLTQAQFNNGGWTWPLSPDVQNNNPYVQLNSYWLK